MSTQQSYLQVQRFIILFVWILCAVYTKTAFGQTWTPLPNLPQEGETQFIATHPENSNLIFIGKGGHLYASFDQGKHWKELMGLGGKAKIQMLRFENNRLFLLTTDGLFESKNQGKTWKKIFGSANPAEKNILSLIQDPLEKKTFYLGTESGFFKSTDAGKHWIKEEGELSHQEVSSVEADGEMREIFIAGEKGLYRLLPNKNRLDRIYATHTSQLSDSQESAMEVGNEQDAELEQTDDSKTIQSLLVVADDISFIAIGTKEGVFLSDDEGNHWERLPLSGLKTGGVSDLVFSKKTRVLFAATEKGVFSYDFQNKRWQELTEGLPFAKINRLTLIRSNPETLYAATKDGAYQILIGAEILKPEETHALSVNERTLLRQLIQYEPTIQIIQKETIKYTNVSNRKTKRWQWASRLRSFVPALSIGKSFSTSDTVDLDRAGTSDPDRYILGPQDKSKSWDFDLNWNLSDLIWNSAQTSIDSRDKLMVELRDDVLSEVTRLYFERRRAQMEFAMRPAPDSFDRINQLFRIDELTASIDTFTGGFLSKRVSEIYAQHPELLNLWKLEVENET